MDHPDGPKTKGGKNSSPQPGAQAYPPGNELRSRNSENSTEGRRKSGPSKGAKLEHWHCSPERTKSSRTMTSPPWTPTPEKDNGWVFAKLPATASYEQRTSNRQLLLVNDS